MDWFPILFNVELILFVITLVFIAKEDVLIRLRRCVIRVIRRRRAANSADEQIHAAPVRPAMTAEEIVKVCDSL